MKKKILPHLFKFYEKLNGCFEFVEKSDMLCPIQHSITLCCELQVMIAMITKCVKLVLFLKNY